MKFANIEEDTPSYHRSYDFFVSRFSEMCHSEHEDPDIQNKSVCSSSSLTVSTVTSAELNPVKFSTFTVPVAESSSGMICYLTENQSATISV